MNHRVEHYLSAGKLKCSNLVPLIVASRGSPPTRPKYFMSFASYSAMRRMLLHCLSHQFTIFIVVGALNTAFGFALFALLLHMGLHYAVASLGSTATGVLFNFKTTGRIVFRSRDNRLALRFIVVYAVVYLLNLAGLRLLTGVGLTAFWAGALLVLPVAILSFFAQRELVFRVRGP